MVSISDMSFGYGRHPLFAHLHLELKPGQIYGLLGKNAAGKTTLLKLIAGLRFPDQGTISVMGMNPADRNPDLLQQLFFVPEEFELPATSIERYHRELSAYYPTFQHDQFDHFIDQFELRKADAIRQLSLGQQKKVLLAFALASGCPLVIMDEPTNGLDIPSKVQFRRLVSMAMTEDSTFILSTHQIRELESLIDPIVILDGGQIVLQQAIATIADRLSFSIQPQAPSASEVVYSERTLGGYALIRQPGSPNEPAPNLELLFSAVVNNPNRIRAIFGMGEEATRD